MPMVSLGILHYLHTLIPNLVLILFENPESRPWTKANPASRAPNKENPAFRTRKNHLGSPRRNRKRWVLWVMWNWVYIYSTGVLAKGSNEQTWSRRALGKDRDFKQRLRKVLVRWPEVIFFRHPSTSAPQVSEFKDITTAIAVKTSLKGVFLFFYSLSRLFPLAYSVKCWRTLHEGKAVQWPPGKANVKKKHL